MPRNNSSEIERIRKDKKKGYEQALTGSPKQRSERRHLGSQHEQVEPEPALHVDRCDRHQVRVQHIVYVDSSEEGCWDIQDPIGSGGPVQHIRHDLHLPSDVEDLQRRCQDFDQECQHGQEVPDHASGLKVEALDDPRHASDSRGSARNLLAASPCWSCETVRAAADPAR